MPTDANRAASQMAKRPEKPLIAEEILSVQM